MARVYMYMYVRYAKGHMLYLVGLIDSVRYDLSCSYTLLPTPRAFYLRALGFSYSGIEYMIPVAVQLTKSFNDSL